MKIEYTNNYLQHENPFHDPKTGQFTFAQGANIAKQTKSTIDTASQYANQKLKPQKGPRKDLSQMSDQDLRKILERERMELEYDRYFNTPTESKGSKFVKDALEIGKVVGGIAVGGLTAVSLIFAIKNEMNKAKGGS